MKQTIRQVLDDMKDSQINLGSEAARETIASLVSAALKTKGTYTELDDSEIENKLAQEDWVCDVCNESTYYVDNDYIGSGTNHLQCELKLELEEEVIGGRVEFEDPKLVGSSEEVDGMYFDDEVEGWEKSVDTTSMTGHDMGGSYEPDTTGMTGHDHGKVWPEQRIVDDAGVDTKTGKATFSGIDAIQKQAYNEMSADGLPEGGDAQAVKESHKLAEEIVNAKKGDWIYESPDGGKTVFRRPFSDYNPENKEEIDWETKEPTGRKFSEYNNGHWEKGNEG